MNNGFVSSSKNNFSTIKCYFNQKVFFTNIKASATNKCKGPQQICCGEVLAGAGGLLSSDV